jgi:hypothetical protein
LYPLRPDHATKLLLINRHLAGKVQGLSLWDGIEPMEELRGYRYCGHYGLLGCDTAAWQMTAEVLLRFDRNMEAAQGKYESSELLGG